MHNFSQVIRRGLNRAAQADDERHKIARLFEAINSAIRHETGGLVELHLDQSDNETFSELHNNLACRTRITVRSVAEPSRTTVLARGGAAADGGLPYELSLEYECVYCSDFGALESRLCEVLGSAEAGRAIRDLMH